MIDFDYYERKAKEEFQFASLDELEYAREQIELHGSNGRGQLATVPMIRIGVIDKLIKYQKELQRGKR